MATIEIPAELESALVAAANELGTTPELLAVEALRRIYAPGEANYETTNGRSDSDFFAGFVGKVDGSSIAYSEATGQKFADAVSSRVKNAAQ